MWRREARPALRPKQFITLWAIARPGELANQAWHLPSLLYHSFPWLSEIK